MSTYDHSDFQPVFVVGFPRSGTTLLATLLGRHSTLAATPETHVMNEFYSRGMGYMLDRGGDYILSNILSRTRIQDMNLSEEALEARMTAFDSSLASLFRAMLEEFAHLQAKPRVLEKTPAHLPYVPTLIEWYPNAKVIGIIRDGRDAVLSNMRMTWTHDNMRRHARLWKWQDGLLEKYERDYPDNFMSVYYEDLVAEPEKTVQSLDTFIGIEFEPGQLDSDPDSATVPSWESDWKKQATSAPDTKKIHEWKTAATPEEIWLMNSMMAPRLIKRGYPDVTLDGCPLPNRLKHSLLNAIYNFAYCPPIEPFFSKGKRLLERTGIVRR